MSTKPILFNTDMKSIRFPPTTADEDIRAILANRKTVTRRVVRPQYGTDAYGGIHRFDAVEVNRFRWSDIPNIWTAIPYPYHPGDILYVRETFFECGGHFYYKADGRYEALEKLGIRFKWRPSIHMPREAARIFLRVTEVRVERLQEITVDGMQAEGAVRARKPPCYYSCKFNDAHLNCMGETCPNRESYEWECWQDSFSTLWNSTKKADRDLYGWDANPWVWVIEFERVDREEATNGPG